MARFLEAGGHQLEYARWGPQSDRLPTLVFLHEGLGCVDQWRDFPGQLSEATGLGAFAYSRLGYGRSDPVSLPRPLRYMHDEAELLSKVLEAAAIANPILIGHSDGASIALIYAGSDGRPGPRGLILEAPHVFAEDAGLQTIAEVREQFLTTDLRAKLERYHGDNLEGAFWGWNGAWLDPGFRSWNLESYLPRIRAPALVIQGRNDPYGTVSQIDAVRQKSGGPVAVELLADCGHSPHRDHPAEVLAAMARFAQRLA